MFIIIICHLKRSIWTKAPSRRTWAIYKPVSVRLLSLSQSPKRSQSWEQLRSETTQCWRHHHCQRVWVSVDLTNLAVFVSRNCFLLLLLSFCFVWFQLKVIYCFFAIHSVIHSHIHSFIHLPYIAQLSHQVIYIFAYLTTWLW